MSETSTSFKTYGGSAPENYERYFLPVLGEPLARDLIEIANLRQGERVLDVACGTGIVARLAAEKVRPGGSVSGLDLNPGMLEVAASVAPPEAEIEWHQSSAEEMPLPDESFDVVLSQLGLQFVPDKAAAVREMYRVLAPGGRLHLSVTGPTPPAMKIFEDALTRHISPEVGPFVAMVFSLYDHDEIRDLFAGGGFRDIEIQDRARKLNLQPPKDFLWGYVHSTPLVEPVSKADDESLAALEREVVDAWQPYEEDGKLTIAPNMVTVSARK